MNRLADDYSFLREAPTSSTYEGSRFVYVLAYGIGSRAMSKIGIARNARRRINDIRAHSPVLIRIMGVWEVPNFVAIWIERAAHDLLRDKHSHNEWFRCDPFLAVSAVKTAIPFLSACREFWIDGFNPDNWRRWHPHTMRFRKAMDDSCSITIGRKGTIRGTQGNQTNGDYNDRTAA